MIMIDRVVGEIRELLGASEASQWQAGRRIAALKASGAWRERAETWEGFCTSELGFSDEWANSLAAVATDFTEEEARVHGVSKLALIRKAPSDAWPELLALSGKREVCQRLRELRGTAPKPKAQGREPTVVHTIQDGDGSRVVLMDARGARHLDELVKAEVERRREAACRGPAMRYEWDGDPGEIAREAATELGIEETLLQKFEERFRAFAASIVHDVREAVDLPAGPHDGGRWLCEEKVREAGHRMLADVLRSCVEEREYDAAAE